MTPYYDEDGITIYHGEAEDVLPTLAAGGTDLILTDPPYNVSVRNGRDGTTVGTVKRKDGSRREVRRNFGEWDRDWQPEPFLREAVRLLRPGGSLLAFTSHYLVAPFLASGLDFRSPVYWRKTNPSPAFPQQYVSAAEMAMWMTKGGPWTFNPDGFRPNVYDHASVGGTDRVHPNQKPVPLMAQLAAVHSCPGDLILDPFMGSGSTLRAVKRVDRRAVGIERDERYCEIAARRLAQGVLAL